jgi:hypothetical protein
MIEGEVVWEVVRPWKGESPSFDKSEEDINCNVIYARH